ncbi:MAG: AAA family ATPase [Bacteroidetes bacterium]|nr:MAG: AAA family ATPase [Bacteroidota bacterium]TAG87224.1 MAG: AAA family ATPase [Bacteroidota bacterium]
MYSIEIQQLKVYADGTFSILITGEKGTGKTFLIKNTCKDIFNEEVFIFKYTNSNSNFEEKLKEKLKEANKKILVFDNIENISFENQIILFDCISTRKGGFFDVFKDEKITCQLIFVSNLSLTQLYNTEFYMPLIDRISQQIIELKPLRKLNFDELKQGYESVWKQMKFKDKQENELPYVPNDEILNWLKTLNLAGNFRDLEKIAILHWRYLIFTEEQKKIFGVENEFQFVKKEFEKSNIKPENEFFVFDKNADDMIKDFRKQLVLWAEKVYSETPKILETLSISEKTLYNWKNGK